MTDLADRVDLVIREFYRTFALSVGGRVVERDGVVACLGVHPSPYVTNTAWRSSPSVDPAGVLRTVDAIYAEVGFEGSLLTSSLLDADLEAAARRSGRQMAIELPVMVTERRPDPTPWPRPASADVRQLDPAVDLAIWEPAVSPGR